MVHVTGILSIFFVFPPPRRRAHGSQSRPLSGSAVVGAGANRQGSALEVKLWAVAVALNAGVVLLFLVHLTPHLQATPCDSKSSICKLEAIPIRFFVLLGIFNL